MKKIKLVVIGAGGRGRTYTSKMDKERFEIVAVAEPNIERRNIFKELHNIPDEMCFDSYEQLLDLPKFADVAMITTTDSLHYAPAMKAIEKGYHLLLEKPVAPTPQECVDIANFAREKGVKVMVCHVLRYTKFFLKIKEMIDNGDLGEVISIHHSENVGNLHHSHSYVRGNWGNSTRSSNMLLAKSCHDIDILQWLIGSKCKNVQSFGLLSHFRSENAPEGAPEYCMDGCPHKDTCYYDTGFIYAKGVDNNFNRHVFQKSEVSDEENERVLRSTQYGKCVYKCDNDVVDHQVVNLEYENGTLVSFNMCAFNEGGRYIRVMGTNGEVYGEMDRNTLDYYDFRTREHTTIRPWEKNLTGSIIHGHGGGDDAMVESLYRYIAEDYKDETISEIDISVESHLTVFAAEESRHNNVVVNVNDYKKKLGLK